MIMYYPAPYWQNDCSAPGDDDGILLDGKQGRSFHPSTQANLYRNQIQLLFYLHEMTRKPCCWMRMRHYRKQPTQIRMLIVSLILIVCASSITIISTLSIDENFNASTPTPSSQSTRAPKTYKSRVHIPTFLKVLKDPKNLRRWFFLGMFTADGANCSKYHDFHLRSNEFDSPSHLLQFVGIKVATFKYVIYFIIAIEPTEICFYPASCASQQVGVKGDWRGGVCLGHFLTLRDFPQATRRTPNGATSSFRERRHWGCLEASPVGAWILWRRWSCGMAWLCTNHRVRPHGSGQEDAVMDQEQVGIHWLYGSYLAHGKTTTWPMCYE